MSQYFYISGKLGKRSTYEETLLADTNIFESTVFQIVIPSTSL